MPVPSWSCDDGRHTLVFSTGARLRPAELADVDAMVAVVGAEERVRYGFTKMEADELRRFFERPIHPSRQEDERLVMEKAGTVRFGGALCLLHMPPGTALLEGWAAVDEEDHSVADDWAMFAELAHEHLGCERAIVTTFPDRPERLDAPRQAGYVDITWPWPRTPLLDGRRVTVLAVEHRAPFRPRTCPR